MAEHFGRILEVIERERERDGLDEFLFRILVFDVVKHRNGIADLACFLGILMNDDFVDEVVRVGIVGRIELVTNLERRDTVIAALDEISVLQKDFDFFRARRDVFDGNDGRDGFAAVFDQFLNGVGCLCHWGRGRIFAFRWQRARGFLASQFLHGEYAAADGTANDERNDAGDDAVIEAEPHDGYHQNCRAENAEKFAGRLVGFFGTLGKELVRR